MTRRPLASRERGTRRADLVYFAMRIPLLLIALGSPVMAQYAAPAILSRGEAPGTMSATGNELRYSLTLSADYTNGLLSTLTTAAQPTLPDRAAFGGGVVIGLNGMHNWEHTQFGLDYSGSFKNYTEATRNSGRSQGLAMSLTHQFSPHVVFSLRESAGIFTRFLPATASLNSAVAFDPSQSYIPGEEFGDERTIFSSTQANLIVQQTSRLSFDLGTTYFINNRKSSTLYGTYGQSETGDLQYRLSPHVTVGAGYDFVHYGYSRAFGGAYVHGGTFSASWRVNQTTELSIYGGPSRVESSFLKNVPFDPAVLAILCPPGFPCDLGAGTVISHNVEWVPTFGARLSRSFERGVVNFSAGEAVTPGNGLFLTSKSITATAGYGYTGLRDWSANISANYASSDSLGSVAGRYGQWGGQFRLSRRITGSVSVVSSFTALQYDSGAYAGYNRLIYTASIGLGFSSGERPVRLF